MSDEKIEQFELDAMLKKHHLFTIGKNGGARLVCKFKNLSGLDFHGVNVSGADFTGSKMQNVLLANCNCNGTIFYGCDLTNSVLDNGTFDRTDFRGAQLIDISMRNVDLSKADTRKGQITQISKEKKERVSEIMLKNEDNIQSRTSSLDLSEKEEAHRESSLDLSITLERWDEMVKNHHLWLSTSGQKGEQMDISHHDMRAQKDLAQTSLTMIKGIDCKFDELYLVQVQMQGGNFSDSSVTKIIGHEADFRGSNLNQVNFSEADLSNAHFESLLIKTPHGEQKLCTNLTGANFQNANLSKARFWDAVLDNTDFRGANIDGADFRGADISKAIFDS